MFFFRLEHFATDDEVEREYDLRGLRPVDPITLAAVNEASPGFADKYRYVTYWKGKYGRWYYVGFGRYRRERYVCVDESVNPWESGVFFAGVLK